MGFSHKIRNLFLASVAVLAIAIAANDGTNNISLNSPPVIGEIPTPTILYPYVPADMDRSAIDPNIDSANVPLVKPKPIGTHATTTRSMISAEAYLVANLDTGEIYFEHNPSTVFPIASLSKLVTALVVLHSMPPDEKLTVTQPELDAYGEAGHLVLGETFTTSELLYPMLLESSNDAAEVFAQSYGYTAFIKKMNDFAKMIGMNSTTFKDASGLSPGNASNAHDLLTLAQYIYHSEQSLLSITRQTTMSVPTTTDHGAHTWNTINPFPLDPHFMGGKTGRTTEAKESMISLFRYDYAGVSYPIAIIVLRSNFAVREIDTSILFEKFFEKIAGNSKIY